jgi:hypothetical protein
MFALHYDVGPWVKNLSDIELRQFPFAMQQALNTAMFAVHRGWNDELPRVFDRPTPVTRRAIRYVKATKQNLVAVVYVQDEVAKGTAPAEYLFSEVAGGVRQPKPFERLLRSAGILASNEFATPGQGMPLDAFGNISGGRIKAILGDLRADRESFAHSNAESRRRRRVRNRKREGQGVYFASRGRSGNRGDGVPQHLARGIYERLTRGFVGPARGGGGGVRLVLAIVGTPEYRVRFDARGLAQQLFNRAFPPAFQVSMARAVLNARPQ